MRIKDLREWDNKKVSIKFRNSLKLEGVLKIKGNVLYIYDAEKHAFAVLPQEVTMITELVK